MSRSELASMIESLGEYQVEELCRMAEGFLSLNEALNDTTPKVCPRCKSETASFIKKGFSGRKQRYQCQDCKRTARSLKEIAEEHPDFVSWL